MVVMLADVEASIAYEHLGVRPESWEMPPCVYWATAQCVSAHIVGKCWCAVNAEVPRFHFPTESSQK